MSAGIYIHIPFCVRKCSYCDFYSQPLSEEWSLEKYCRSLIGEIQAKASAWKEYEFSTVYMGGGTPSLLKPDHIGMILDAVFANYKIAAQPEISMEANPATLNLNSLREIQTAGINRLSLGVQSFRDEELKILGRIHGAREVMDTILALDKAGINNYNLDLIYGIPGQTMHDWMYNLRMAVQCHPQHISAYLLQLDPGTPLSKTIHSGALHALDEDMEADMYYSCLDFLENEGYHHYEISNYATAGHECGHNLIYWQAREYLGLGAGAVSYQNSQRTINRADLNAYLNQTDKGQFNENEILEEMNPAEKLTDAVILGLRMISGIKPAELLQRFGIDFCREYHSIIEKLEQDGLLIIGKDNIRLSRKGYFLSNRVFCQFL